jgi:hypothetical protein
LTPAQPPTRTVEGKTSPHWPRSAGRSRRAIRRGPAQQARRKSALRAVLRGSDDLPCGGLGVFRDRGGPIDRLDPDDEIAGLVIGERYSSSGDQDTHASISGAPFCPAPAVGDILVSAPGSFLRGAHRPAFWCQGRRKRCISVDAWNEVPVGRQAHGVPQGPQPLQPGVLGTHSPRPFRSAASIVPALRNQGWYGALPFRGAAHSKEP